MTFLLINIDAMGEIQWLKNYTNGTPSAAVLTSDGGYAIAGTGEANLVKIDSSGIMQWSKKYAALNSSFVRSVVQTGDGGFVIAGDSDYAIIVKTDSNGDVQWIKIMEHQIMWFCIFYYRSG